MTQNAAVWVRMTDEQRARLFQSPIDDGLKRLLAAARTTDPDTERELETARREVFALRAKLAKIDAVLDADDFRDDGRSRGTAERVARLVASRLKFWTLSRNQRGEIARLLDKGS